VRPAWVMTIGWKSRTRLDRWKR